ncbi:MAG: D-alanyl-D-alanine carboxypeptidase, partial [Bacteroidales bacterium]|nr:D-alanyl-D-alanine carboxypeptidase [Bacteroidales bacterium]
MMRKISITLLFVLTISLAFGQFRKLEKRKHSVNKLLNEIKADSDFKNASFAFFALDANTGEIISSYNSDMALRPASNQKLISTATILELYGPDYQFKTSLEYTGSIDTLKHILNGNIIIKGGGDPSLGSIYFDETKDKQFLNQWTKAIQKLGIDSIAGAIIADAGIYSKDI